MWVSCLIKSLEVACFHCSSINGFRRLVEYLLRSKATNGRKAQWDDRQTFIPVALLSNNVLRVEGSWSLNPIKVVPYLTALKTGLYNWYYNLILMCLVLQRLKFCMINIPYWLSVSENYFTSIQIRAGTGFQGLLDVVKNTEFHSTLITQIKQLWQLPSLMVKLLTSSEVGAHLKNSFEWSPMFLDHSKC